MGRHVLTELVNLAAGVAGALAITAAAAWAYPLGREVIWGCGLFAAAATALIGLGPVRRARALDRGRA